MNSPLKPSTLKGLAALVAILSLLATACSGSVAIEETANETTAAPTSAAAASATMETIDPGTINSREEASTAMAAFAAADSPEATADPETYIESLPEAELQELMARTFGFTTEEESQTFVNRLMGISPEDLATFTVDGSRVMMTGLISSSTPDDVRKLIAENPEVTTIVMLDVPGSIDDEANLEAALLVRDAGLNTHLNADGDVASGGVDFFLAGVERTFETGAAFGVHSWGDGNGNEGKDIPKDDAEHLKYLDYYDQVGIDAEFYWFTLQAASADDIHYMTPEELETYGFATAASG